MYSFKESTFQSALPLIQSSDQEHAFLPSAKDKQFSAEEFLVKNSTLDGFHIFVTSNNKALLSFISIWPQDTNILILGPMFVKSEFRGLGIGKFQVTQIINWAKKKEFKHILTKTWGSNKGANNIFQSLNFQQTKEILKDRINGDNTIIYTLNLN